jgi:hypothetical protein
MLGLSLSEPNRFQCISLSFKAIHYSHEKQTKTSCFEGRPSALLETLVFRLNRTMVT